MKPPTKLKPIIGTSHSTVGDYVFPSLKEWKIRGKKERERESESESEK